MDTIKRIYLAGSVYENEPDKSWKKEFMNYLSHEDRYYIVDPNPIKEHDPLKLGMINFNVVGADKRTIDNSDIVVAFINKASFGTAMEIHYAYSKQNISIYVINPNKKFKKDIWLNFHCSMMFDNIKDCADQINMIHENILIHQPKFM
jgi:nucleoside 2-deoxyribosyltransferase